MRAGLKIYFIFQVVAKAERLAVETGSN